MDSNTLKLVREALAELIEQCRSVEKTLTEEHHHVHYSGESLPLCKARQALAALDAAQMAEPMDGWQDIATAPRDGRWVITWSQASGLGLSRCGGDSDPAYRLDNDPWCGATDWLPHDLPAAPKETRP